MHSIAEIIVLRAEASPDRRAYLFLDDNAGEEHELSCRQLLEGAGSVAGALARYPKQARILIALPTSPEFCHVFYGCMLANKVAVPIPIPNAHRLEAVLKIVVECQTSCIVVVPSLRRGLRAALDSAGIRSVDVLCHDDLRGSAPARLVLPAPTDIALLQFTSGSTTSPKGVKITHANIIANERMICESFRHTESSTVVGWTPLNHDQGLIGNLIQPLYVGASCVLMAPTTFLRKPRLWLQAISTYSAHTSGGPNFCYDLCIARISDADCQGLDLSCWQVAFNGAEPISAATLRRFATRFSPYGFRADAFFLCYGMAEASLYVSGGYAETLWFEEAREVHELPPIHSGRPHPDTSIVLRRMDEAPSVDDAEEICIAGPNVTSGYWGGQAADSFFEQDGRRYFRTGDLGCLDDGRLVVTGRAKEVIIVRGRNIHPYDIERTIVETHEAFLPSACAVIAVGPPDSQYVIAVQEIERTARHALDYNAIAGEVRKSVVRKHDVQLKRVLFAAPGFIPKTSSGKIKRTLLAQHLQHSDLAHSGIIAAA
ncbi:MAG: fatty acyl-AMP ligase [Ramlibacter sp.]|nr:fatty acyl-AMP ligase [Ramlibacter sp.]